MFMGAIVAALVLGVPSVSRATPQVSAGATAGVALTDLRTDAGPRPALHLGLRADALFFRSRPEHMGLGPYVDVATHAFDTLEAGGGLAWLIPTGATAFVLSGGAFGRTSSHGLEPGVAGTLFWGSRSYNFHSPYGIAAGLFAQGRYGLGDGQQGDVILGARVDLEYLALPFLFAYEALTR